MPLVPSHLNEGDEKEYNNLYSCLGCTVHFPASAWIGYNRKATTEDNEDDLFFVCDSKITAIRAHGGSGKGRTLWLLCKCMKTNELSHLNSKVVDGYRRDGRIFGQMENCKCTFCLKQKATKMENRARKTESPLKAIKSVWYKQSQRGNYVTRRNLGRSVSVVGGRNFKQDEKKMVVAGVTKETSGGRMTIRLKKHTNGVYVILSKTDIDELLNNPMALRKYCHQWRGCRRAIRKILLCEGRPYARREQLSLMSSLHNTAGFVNGLEVRPNKALPLWIHKICRTISSKNWLVFCDLCGFFSDRVDHPCRAAGDDTNEKLMMMTKLNDCLMNEEFRDVLGKRGAKSGAQKRSGICPAGSESVALTEFKACFEEKNGRKQLATLIRIESKRLSKISSKISSKIKQKKETKKIMF